MSRFFVKAVSLVFSFVLLGSTFSTFAVSLGDFFSEYIETIAPNVPQSYKYIDLQYKNTNLTASQRTTLQKMVYLDLFPNVAIMFPYNVSITEQMGSLMIERNYPALDVAYDKWLLLTDEVLSIWLSQLPSYFERYGVTSTNLSDYPMLTDVQAQLETYFLYKDRINQKDMEYGAIQGLVKSLDDTYTVFMPPAESQVFYDGLSETEFSGIWAYIELTNEWQLMVVAPIRNSPADRAGILASDIIIQIDDYIIKWDENITELVDRIKWPTWTKVSLTVLRKKETLTIDVVRATIIVPLIESEMLANDVFYLRINSFGNGVGDLVIKELQNFQTLWAKKLIIDVTNNPGGLLDDTVDILQYFVPKWSIVATTRSLWTDQSYVSQWSEFSFSTIPTVILTNAWSASASEILAWVVSEYNNKAIILWRQSFGKWSVQSLLDYADGSSLKITTAKRYVADRTDSIEGVWIPVDIISDKTWEELIDEAMMLLNNM